MCCFWFAIRCGCDCISSCWVLFSLKFVAVFFFLCVCFVFFLVSLCFASKQDSDGASIHSQTAPFSSSSLLLPQSHPLFSRLLRLAAGRLLSGFESAGARVLCVCVCV